MSRRWNETEAEHLARARETSRNYYHNNREERIQYQRDYRKTIDPRKWTEWSRKSRHGMTKEQFEDLLAEQDGKCAICEDPIDVTLGRKRDGQAVVDHNHETGENRGLLCMRCNMGLGGFFRDKKENVERAVAYLEKYK